jgi:hypothetical protein
MLFQHCPTCRQTYNRPILKMATIIFNRARMTVKVYSTDVPCCDCDGVSAFWLDEKCSHAIWLDEKISSMLCRDQAVCCNFSHSYLICSNQNYKTFHNIWQPLLHMIDIHFPLFLCRASFRSTLALPRGTSLLRENLLLISNSRILYGITRLQTQTIILLIISI